MGWPTLSQPNTVHNEADELLASRRHIRRFLLQVLLAGFLLFLVAILSQFASRPLQISAETTYITQPLKSDGQQVDYFAAIEQEVYPPTLATEENGFRLLIAHLGLPLVSDRWHFEQMCRKLGLDPAQVRPDMTYEEPSDFLKEYVQDPKNSDVVAAALDRIHAARGLEAGTEEDAETGEPQAESVPTEEATESNGSDEEGEAQSHQLPSLGMSMGPNQVDPQYVLEQRLSDVWTFDDLPMMEQWLADNGPALDLLGKAVRKPVFCIPLIRDDEDDLLIVRLLPAVQMLRVFARGLTARAHYRIGAGDIDGAIDDIIACQRLGRHVSYGPTIVEMLVGIAIEGLARSVGPAGSLDHPPTKEQLQRLVDELDQLPPRGDLTNQLRYERFLVLDSIQALAQGDESAKWMEEYLGVPEPVRHAVRWIGLDWNLIAQKTNDHLDAMIDCGTEPPEPALRPILLLSRSARSHAAADLMAGLLVPSAEATREAFRRAGCTENMQRIALAMLLYECDHGSLPPAFTVDESGRPLHSWRVLLLPYLGHQELYDQLHLDEPWDSEHNRALHAAEVPWYQCPTAALAPGRTTYSVVVGEKTAFGTQGQGRRLDASGPLSGNMILVVERKTDVCWMQPDSEMTDQQALRGVTFSGVGICCSHVAGANIAMRNGAVGFLSENLEDPAILRGQLEGTSDELP